MDATSPDQPQIQPPNTSKPNPDRRPAPPPTQSREDTDAGWGESPDPDDAERLIRERPPHWE
ncbi:MAG TPA: hypothetical protein VFI65_17185 [Streptosporangiaceae bacterium]|nr:hypothetical protein [Streptosporangiaceae bacterium]